MNFLQMVKKPGAYLPLAMSCAALAVVALQLWSVGPAREPDEGTAAHVFQLLMVAQLPIMAVFAMRFAARQLRQCLLVLMAQACAAAIALAPVWWFNL